MNLQPFLSAPGAIQLHAVCALAALGVGIVQLSRHKGDAAHRVTGYAWVGLMLVTVMNATIAETVTPSLTITILVALSVAFKGCMVVEHFMGMKNAHGGLRLLMNIYFVVVPLMMVIVALYPETIASLTTLG